MYTSFISLSRRFLIAIFLAASVVSAESPRLVDPRLQMTLFAESPEIVTPIGMAIDRADQVFVIESHTHQTPDDYDGPSSDRIKVFVDQDGDGRADKIHVYADGIRQAMNLAFSPDGELYVVCAREVLHLVDQDKDGKCDRKDQVLKLLTKQRYAHNSLLGITFDRDGWMYISRGNVGSEHYRFKGQDDSIVEGHGDGGSVIRCRPNGTQISEFATGFWNPFDLKFDRSGRLLLVDNDPDARGPNRLLQVVRGGDYGYKSMFGGSGTHPFQGWDGTLPGTLPFISGTGEAPSGLIDCRRTSFPIEYKKSVLATIWNENSIERFELDPSTGQLESKSIFMSGGQDFRPVALDCDSDGNLFITDWVLVDYPNHGRGRIWRVSAKKEAPRIKPENNFEPYGESDQRDQIDRIRVEKGMSVVGTLSDGNIVDPLVRHAAVMRLAGEGMEAAREKCLEGNASLRMIGLLASRRANPDDVPRINHLLSDPDPEIRRASLMWAAETMELGLAERLAQALDVQPVTVEVFEAYLAACEVLTLDFKNAYQSTEKVKASKIKRTLSPGVITDVANNPKLPVRVRAMAIDRYSDSIGLQQAEVLHGLLNSRFDALSVAAIQAFSRLSLGSEEERIDDFIAIATDPARSAMRRTFALAALATTQGCDPARLEPLTEDLSNQVAVQARRAISELSGSSTFSKRRPKTNDDWHAVLASGGDPLLGRHVFFSSRAGCAKCHQMDGRGGTLGPGLNGIAQSKTRRQIVDSILNPSAEFPPQYQAWMVLTEDGTVYRGLQLDHKSKGSISMTLENGKNRFFQAHEIEAYRALPRSLMPSGMADLMSVGEMRDLVAYLSTLEL